MSNLVQVDFGQQMNGDILKFCLAKMNKEKIETETEPERRRIREQVKTYTSLMTEHMTKKKTNLVYLHPKGDLPETWVVLKPVSVAPKKLSAVAVTDVLRNTRMEELQTFESQNMTEVLQQFLVSSFSRQHMGKYTVSVQTKPPRMAKKVDLIHQSPELLEVARNLVDSKLSSKTTRGKVKQAMCKEDSVCELASPSVARYIHTVSPAIPIAPVQVELGGEHNKFYVRAREVNKTKSMTLKTLIPLCREVIKDVLESNGLGDELTTDTLAKLQSPSCINAILETLEAKIDSYKQLHSETTKKITLERGLPRRIISKH
tara:strand:- start:6666 stop:7616 length:951 start_codon:yes stop_codon:yes gene_type:complete